MSLAPTAARGGSWRRAQGAALAASVLLHVLLVLVAVGMWRDSRLLREPPRPAAGQLLVVSLFDGARGAGATRGMGSPAPARPAPAREAPAREAPRPEPPHPAPVPPQSTAESSSTAAAPLAPAPEAVPDGGPGPGSGGTGTRGPGPGSGGTGPGGVDTGPGGAGLPGGSGAGAGPDRGPRLLAGALPLSPEDPDLAGAPAEIVVRLLVGVDGRVARTEPITPGLSPRVEAAVRRSANEMRFVPARRGAEPVEAWFTMTFAYRR